MAYLLLHPWVSHSCHKLTAEYVPDTLIYSVCVPISIMVIAPLSLHLEYNEWFKLPSTGNTSEQIQELNH